MRLIRRGCWSAYEHAGVLGELVIQADKASVAQELGGDPAKAMAAPKHALQRKLLDGLRYLLKSELKINQAGPADGWLTQDALWLVSKTVSDKLRAHLLAQGIDGIPANNTAVFNVLQEHGMLQPTPDGKAIWRAIITSESGWSHSFTLLRLSPALIWEAAERLEPFAGTVAVEMATGAEEAPPPPAPDSSSNSVSSVAAASVGAVLPQDEVRPPNAMEDLLAMMSAAPDAGSDSQVPATDSTPSEPAASFAPAPSLSTPMPTHADPPATMDEPSGEHFLAWLKHAIASRHLVINDAKALVHTVDGTAYLVSPGVFQRYVQQYPQVGAVAKMEKLPDWQWVQRRFEKLGLHRKQADGLNIWTCSVTGPRKSRKLHGYLLLQPQRLFDEVPPNNPYLALA